MIRGCILLLPALGLLACSPEPIDYIPPTDRALLQAQARLGGSGADAGPVSVADMLSRARNSPAAPAASAPLVLQFAGDAVLPDESQKQSLARFAAAAKGRRITVVSRRGGFEDGTALLGQRRALAVAHEVSPDGSDVELRFADGAPADSVVVSLAVGPATAAQDAP